MASGVAPWVQKAVGGSPVGHGLTLEKVADERVMGRGGFTLTSAAFAHGGELDPSFTAIEEDSVAPPLEWTAPPPGTQELVLIAEDADKGHVHWTVWGLAPQKGKLMEGEVPPRTGKNAQGNSEWLLPAPPEGEKRHYVFQIFATELPLTLMPGASRDDVLGAIKGFVTGCAVIHAPYTGGSADDEAWEDEDF